MDKVVVKDFFDCLFANNGPEETDFKILIKIAEDILPEQIISFRKLIYPILNPSTLIGFTYARPFGYSGDFFIIEKIYQRYVSSNYKYLKWDLFFHSMVAVEAVINRKNLAVKKLTSLNLRANGSPKNVLVLGSGPTTEINEYLFQTPENTLLFDLIDIDQRAIKYAKLKNRAFMHCLKFHNRNVIRFIPDKKYDLIWSAGLFDYFKSQHFVYLINRLYRFLNLDGEMIIGNFSNKNHSRRCMEVYGDWFLYHRTEDELETFALQADIPSSKIDIIKEPLGINLFLKARS